MKDKKFLIVFFLSLFIFISISLPTSNIYLNKNIIKKVIRTHSTEHIFINESIPEKNITNIKGYFVDYLENKFPIFNGTTYLTWEEGTKLNKRITGVDFSTADGLVCNATYELDFSKINFTRLGYPAIDWYIENNNITTVDFIKAKHFLENKIGISISNVKEKLGLHDKSIFKLAKNKFWSGKINLTMLNCTYNGVHLDLSKKKIGKYKYKILHYIIDLDPAFYDDNSAEWDLGIYNQTQTDGENVTLLYSNASLLLNFEGNEGDTSTTDDSGNNFNLTFIADAKITTNDKKFGVSSLELDGTDDFVNVSVVNNDMSPLEFGNDDFTIEFWFSTDIDPGSHKYVIDNYYDNSDTRISFALRTDYTYLGSALGNTVGTWAEGVWWSTNTWYHVAIVRHNGVIACYINGSIVKEVNDANDYSGLSAFTIGHRYTASSGGDWDGTIDGFRIIKGIALYTENFTLPNTKPGRYLYDEGNYTSRIFDAGQNLSWDNITWKSVTIKNSTVNTSISMKYRTSDDNITWSSWYSAVNGQGNLGSGRYFQYKAILTTNNTDYTPYLQSVNISYSLFNAPPTVALNLPANNTNQSYNYAVLNATVYDDDLDNLTVRFYGDGSLINVTYAVNGSSVIYNWTGLNDGLHNWSVKADDGTANSTEPYFFFTVDTIPPVISIQFPKNITYNYNTSIPLNFTSGDATTSVDKCWFNLDNGNNITLTNCNNATFNVSEGFHTLYIFANDTVGNINNSESVSFSIDITIPTITINKPLNKTYNYTNITLEFYNSEILDTCILELNGVNHTLASCDNTTFTATANQKNIIALWGNDTAGNYGRSTDLVFSVDTIIPRGVENLENQSSTQNSIYWNWTNPTDSDFNHSEIWINGTFYANVSVNYYNATGLNPSTMYEIQIITVDDNGNKNMTWVMDNGTTSVIVLSLSISSPVNATYNITPSLNYSFSNGSAIDKCWYTLDEGLTNTTLTNCENLSSIGAEGNNHLIVYINDTKGNEANDDVYFSLDFTPPSINFISPTPSNESTINRDYSITINVSHNESGTIKLYIDGILNETRNYTLSYTNFTKSFLAGNHTFYVWINDTAGNVNYTETRTIFVSYLNEDERYWLKYVFENLGVSSDVSAICENYPDSLLCVLAKEINSTAHEINETVSNITLEIWNFENRTLTDYVISPIVTSVVLTEGGFFNVTYKHGCGDNYVFGNTEPSNFFSLYGNRRAKISYYAEALPRNITNATVCWIIKRTGNNGISNVTVELNHKYNLSINVSTPEYLTGEWIKKCREINKSIINQNYLEWVIYPGSDWGASQNIKIGQDNIIAGYSSKSLDSGSTWEEEYEFLIWLILEGYSNSLADQLNEEIVEMYASGIQSVCPGEEVVNIIDFQNFKGEAMYINSHNIECSVHKIYPNNSRVLVSRNVTVNISKCRRKLFAVWNETKNAETNATYYMTCNGTIDFDSLKTARNVHHTNTFTFVKECNVLENVIEIENLINAYNVSLITKLNSILNKTEKTYTNVNTMKSFITGSTPDYNYYCEVEKFDELNDEITIRCWIEGTNATSSPQVRLHIPSFNENKTRIYYAYSDGKVPFRAYKNEYGETIVEFTCHLDSKDGRRAVLIITDIPRHFDNFNFDVLSYVLNEKLKNLEPKKLVSNTLSMDIPFFSDVIGLKVYHILIIVIILIAGYFALKKEE